MSLVKPTLACLLPRLCRHTIGSTDVKITCKIPAARLLQGGGLLKLMLQCIDILLWSMELRWQGRQRLLEAKLWVGMPMLLMCNSLHFCHEPGSTCHQKMHRLTISPLLWDVHSKGRSPLCAS